MCMLKKDGETETCKLAESVAAIDGRVGKLESRMDRFDNALSVGFAQVNSSVQQLAHDFGERMNIIEKKVVDEKQEWGKSFRKWLDWIVKLLIVGCGAAMGMTAWKMIFGN